MKAVRIGLAVLVAALSIHSAVVFAADTRHERVSFRAGASSATLKGTIKGYEIIDYLLGAKAGQTMNVTLKTSNGANYFNVLPPGSDAAVARGDTSGNAWTGTLPVDGDYRVRVYLMRSAARRNEVANYTLTVGITGGPVGQRHSGDARFAGNSFHATGNVPCSVGPDPKGSAQCSFGVIRGGPGNAEVHLAPPGFDVKLHPDKVEEVLTFTGNTVTSANPQHKVTAEKQGDEWSIGVNDFRFYIIPEAVILGG